MSLRDEAITHMAEAYRVDMDATEFRDVAELHLDALLDFLDAHTEEWEDDADVETESSIRLVAALRGTTE